MSLEDAIERVRAADDDAHASQLSFVLGPEMFVDRFRAQAAKLRERLEAEYVVANSSGEGR